MFPVRFFLGPIIISPFGLFSLLAFVIGSFFFWRSLREDYPEEEIITLTILTTLGALAGARIFYVFFHFSEFGFDFGKWLFFPRFPGFSLLGAVLGGISVPWWWSKKKNWDTWLIFDSATFSFLLAFLLGTIGLFASTGEMLDLLRLVIVFLVLFLCFLFKKNYRKFIWYQSGKPGFIFCTTLAVFSGAAFLFAILTKNGIYWEETGFLVLVLFGLGFLYYRSEREFRQDLASLKNLLKRKNES